MIAALILMSLALAALLFLAIRYVYRRFELSFKQEGKIHELDGQTKVMILREQVMREFLDELKRGRIAEGKAEGYKEIAKAMPGIYGQHFTAMIEQVKSNTQLLIDGEIAKYRLLMEKGDAHALKDKLDIAATNNKILRDNQDELMKQRDRYKLLYEGGREEKPGSDLVETVSEPVEISDKSQHQPRENKDRTQEKLGSNPILPTPIQGKVLSLAGEYHYDDSHRDYYFDFDESIEGLRVMVKRKRDDHVIGQFYQNRLTPGETIQVGKKYVVLCGLPGCQAVKISQQPTTRCCSREHAIEWRRIQDENSRIAEGQE